MNRIVFRMMAIMGVILLSGCAEIRQVIHVDHDGAGKIVEEVTVTRRGYRLMKGMASRSGKNIEKPTLMTRAFLLERANAMGEVQLASHKEVPLGDGRTRWEVEYTFKDLNKIVLCHAPSMKYRYPGIDRTGATEGKVLFGFEKGPVETRYATHREILTLKTLMRTQNLGKEKSLHNPAERQEVMEIVPIFQEMLKNFSLSIVIQAPIEEFEEKEMIYNFRVRVNRATVLRIDGEDLSSNPEVVRQFISNQVPSGAFLHDSMYRMIPGTESPWFHNNFSKKLYFMKSVPKIQK